MATCYQKITWQISKEKLSKMITDAHDDYSALEFQMCIEDHGVTNYYMTLLDVPSGEGFLSAPTKVCPVPPDCN
jgi:hypothetical protein